MKKVETRQVGIYYCGICGEECGLPYHGYDSIGYGSCCSRLMSKLEKAEVIEELCKKVPLFADFFSRREQAKENKEQ